MRANDIMSTPVFGVTADATLEEAAALMLERGFTTLPVITAEGRLTGLVTEADLGRARFTPGARDESSPDDGAIAGLRPHTVRQIMCGTPLTVPPDADLSDVASVLVDSHQRCVPVVAHGKVVGMISWRDLLTNLVLRH